MRYRAPTTPIMPKHYRFGLFPVRSPLLGESFLFSLPTGTKMFQFPAFASIFYGYRAFNSVGFPIRTFMGQWLFAPHHDFSQLITSFFACKSLGIHHTPFLTSFASPKHYLLLDNTLKGIYTFSCILISTRIRFLYVCRNMSKIAGSLKPRGE